ncbi:MAG: tRNA (adenosine(37)-N6)-dimethylallyltransferase MiaA [Clostridia bacterium]|nr:tRNA (adenosine(37)-N6)-dimethylallyltransferase MiaA [Clostridia bacterium]
MQRIKKALAIVGSTASGKSALALSAAEHFSGEIISVDSMQIYKSMDIGTAKPSSEELARVKHHMIDICPPHTAMSSADFAEMALSAAEDAEKRGKLPIFCGGTGLYLDAIMRGGAPEETAADEKIRESLMEFAKNEGAHALHERLREVDCESAEKIHENNVKRVARALEVYLVSGKPKSLWDRESLMCQKAVEPFCVCLSYHSRERLYERIDRRVDEMIENGLVEETKRLLDMGVFKSNFTAAAAIGYKELLPYVRGDVTLEIAAEELKRATRRYAKRQITWFGAKDFVHHLMCDTEDGEMKPFDEIFEEFCRMAKENGF